VGHLIASDGWRGLYRGVVPALILTCNPAILFLAFEWLKRGLLWMKASRLTKINVIQEAAAVVQMAAATPATAAATQQLTAIDLFILGAVSKVIATVVGTLPLAY
jgi:maltodextrin utilization protein YvdJ